MLWDSPFEPKRAKIIANGKEYEAIFPRMYGEAQVNLLKYIDISLEEWQSLTESERRNILDAWKAKLLQLWKENSG